MSHIYKTTELVGSSTVGIDDAIQSAIAAAGMTINHMGWFEVLEQRGHIENGKIAHWQVTVKIGFRLDSGKSK